MITFSLSDIKNHLNATLNGEDIGFTGCSTDSRRITTDCLYVALQGERFDGHHFINEVGTKGAKACLVDQPVHSNLPTLQVTNTRIALGQLAKLWRQQFVLPVVAITGSNGKTTVKEMVKSILSQCGQVLATQGNLNNDIGLPLTLFNLDKAHQYAVIEMGANHQGEIRELTHIAQPTVATITQCAPAHLAGFGSIEKVAHAKGEIFSGLTEQNDIAIINADDHYATLWKNLATSYQMMTFGLQPNTDITAVDVHLNACGSQFMLSTPQGNVDVQLPLLGQHNVMNSLAASGCALACGCSLTQIQQGLQTMQPVEGRLHTYPGINNSLIIDDSYNANPGSLKAAIKVLNNYPNPRWLVLGDMYELGNASKNLHAQVGEMAKAMGIDQLWTIGDLAQHAAHSFGHHALHFEQQDSLIQSLRDTLLNEGATVLIKGSRGMKLEKVVTALRK